MNKEFFKFKRYFNDWLSWLSFISALIIVIILFWYFYTQGDFEKEAANWGDFGSLLGAITGLIAFIGVLFTLRQSKQQFTNSEDRAIFFELLKIFIAYRDALCVQRIDWEYDTKQCKWEINSYNELCEQEKTYQQIYVELYHCFYYEIRKSIPDNFSIEEFTNKNIPEKITVGQWILTYRTLAIAIDNIYKEHGLGQHGGSVVTIPIHQNAYDYLCLNAIKIYMKENNLKPITEALAKAADYCFEPYKNQLGTYFRNAYYILDTVSDFKSPQKYSNIFRAQLSKKELAILFFNSFSSLSNHKTRQLYLDADLFNNLELKDIRLKESTGNIPRMGYISFPSILQPKAVRNEYISYEFLSKLYKSIDTKND